MARKSGWQQFADNFNSVYGAFRDVAKEWEMGDINKLEATAIETDDMGEPVKWDYGGQTFDAKPTANQMREVKYGLMGDVMAKYGDVKGAMSMQLDREKLIADREANLVNRQIRDELIRQRGGLKSREMEAGIENTESSTGLNNANISKVNQAVRRDKAMLPGDLLRQSADLENVEANTDNTLSITARRDLLAPGEQDQQAATLEGTKATTADTKSQTAARDAKLGAQVEGLELDNVGKGLKNEGQETQNKRDEVKLDTESDAYQIKRPMNEALIDFGQRAAHGEFDDDPNAGSAALMEIYQTYDPVGAKSVMENFNAQEIMGIAKDGTRIAAEVKAALADGANWRQNVIEFIDKENGIELDADIVEDEDGFHLASMKDGKSVDYIISAPSMDALRTKIATEYTDPAGSFGLAKQLAEVDKLRAEANKLNSEAIRGPRDYMAELQAGKLGDLANTPEFLSEVKKAQKSGDWANVDAMVKQARSMMANGGGLRANKPASKPASAEPKYSVGQVIEGKGGKKYKFLGGDWQDQANYEEVK